MSRAALLVPPELEHLADGILSIVRFDPAVVDNIAVVRAGHYQQGNRATWVASQELGVVHHGDDGGGPSARLHMTE